MSEKLSQLKTEKRAPEQIVSFFTAHKKSEGSGSRSADDYKGGGLRCGSGWFGGYRRNQGK